MMELISGGHRGTGMRAGNWVLRSGAGEIYISLELKDKYTELNSQDNLWQTMLSEIVHSTLYETIAEQRPLGDF